MKIHVELTRKGEIGSDGWGYEVATLVDGRMVKVVSSIYRNYAKKLDEQFALYEEMYGRRGDKHLIGIELGTNPRIADKRLHSRATEVAQERFNDIEVKLIGCGEPQTKK